MGENVRDARRKSLKVRDDNGIKAEPNIRIFENLIPNAKDLHIEEVCDLNILQFNRKSRCYTSTRLLHFWIIKKVFQPLNFLSSTNPCNFHNCPNDV